MTRSPSWVKRPFAVLANAMSCGGIVSVDDTGLNEALRAPEDRWAWSDCDLADLAAEYVWAIASFRPFGESNLRTAWLIARSFLIRNGTDVVGYAQTELSQFIIEIARGSTTKAKTAAWIRRHMIGFG